MSSTGRPGGEFQVLVGQHNACVSMHVNTYLVIVSASQIGG